MELQREKTSMDDGFIRVNVSRPRNNYELLRCAKVHFNVKFARVSLHIITIKYGTYGGEEHALSDNV